MDVSILSKAKDLNNQTANLLAELASISSLSGREGSVVNRLKKEMESHRFKELLLKDIETYPSSAISTIHERIGFEINIHKIRRMLNRLVADGYLIGTSSRRWKRYSIAQKEPNNQ
ncbi:MAG: hypothetical protein WC703_03570 [Candidatus Neomarinimicrobiota bacterium]